MLDTFVTPILESIWRGIGIDRQSARVFEVANSQINNPQNMLLVNCVGKWALLVETTNLQWVYMLLHDLPWRAPFAISSRYAALLPS
jgi:hypothetical protein